MTSHARPDWSGRLGRLQQAISARRLEALVVSESANVRYLTGFSGSSGLLVVSPDRVIFVTDGRYLLEVTEKIAAGRLVEAEVVSVTRRYDVTLGEVTTGLGARAVGFEAGHVTVATLGAWQRAAPDVAWSPTERLVEDYRMIKDGWEQAIFRKAGALLGGVARRLPEFVQAGRIETEVAASLDVAIHDAGFSRTAFPTIVASGPNSARPHARPGPRTLGPGDLVVLDFGGVLDGYCVDLTRMAAVGPVSDRARALFDAVAAAQAAAVASVRPGTTCSAIDAAARDLLDGRGLGQAFMHATGHGLGLEIHEAPRVARADSDPPVSVELGMVFTVEPGAYVEGVGGVRLEDDVLVTATGCEVLTDAPRGLTVV